MNLEPVTLEQREALRRALSRGFYLWLIEWDKIDWDLGRMPIEGGYRLWLTDGRRVNIVGDAGGFCVSQSKVADPGWPKGATTA